MTVEPGEGDFLRVIRPPAGVVKALKYTVPSTHRYFKEGFWYVHSTYIEGIVQMAEKESVVSYTNDLSTEQAYRVLFLTPQAPMVIVEAVWKALAKEYHPDCGGDAEKFKALVQAYELIKKRG